MFRKYLGQVPGVRDFKTSKGRFEKFKGNTGIVTTHGNYKDLQAISQQVINFNETEDVHHMERKGIATTLTYEK